MRTHAQRGGQSQKGESCGLARPCAPARGLESRTVLRARRPDVNHAARQPTQVNPQGAATVSDVGASARFGHDLSRIPVRSTTPLRIQTKLAVSAPGDGHEEEADRVSGQLMRGPEPTPRRACECGGGCSGCRTKQPEREGAGLLSRRAAGASAGGGETAPPVVHEVLSQPGRPLDSSTRSFMEPRFGRDLSHVRIHTGRKAAESARAVKALAYTVGSEVVFGDGEFSPHTHAGRRLLAHELVHTLQQGHAGLLRRQVDVALRDPSVRAQVAGSETVDGFALNGHALTAKHAAKLRALAERLKEVLREFPSGSVEITGHTDAVGEEAYNDRLGGQRAQAVADFLRALKVPAAALHASSAGEGSLLVQTSKPEPRNRRVEVRFITGAAAKATTTTTQTGQTTPPASPAAPKTPQVPRPEDLCKVHPEICDPIVTKPETMPECRPSNCSAVSGGPFDELPPDLKLVLVKSARKKGDKEDAAEWFSRLDSDDRTALTQVFNRLCKYGVWCNVRLVLKVTPGEAPVVVGDRIFKVPGATPSVYFNTPSWPALFDALMGTGRFCRAHGAGASQHPGQITLREISGSDSLHVSIGPGDTFDAHVDRFSPTPESDGSGLCSNAPSGAAVGHIGRELAPEKIRKGFNIFGVHVPGPAGVQVLPEQPSPAPVPPGSVGSDSSPDIIRMTLRGPVRARRPRGDVPLLPASVERVLAEEIPKRVRSNALVPPNAEREYAAAARAAEFAGPKEERSLIKAREEALERLEDFAGDAHSFAKDLARRMALASSRGWPGFTVQLGASYMRLTPDERSRVVEQVRDMARVARALLGERAGGVYRIAVAFGEEVISEVSF